jgi:hypothetical protein
MLNGISRQAELLRLRRDLLTAAMSVVHTSLKVSYYKLGITEFTGADDELDKTVLAYADKLREPEKCPVCGQEAKCRN